MFTVSDFVWVATALVVLDSRLSYTTEVTDHVIPEQFHSLQVDLQS